MENGSVESNMDYKDLVPEVSSGKSINYHARAHSCDALAKDEAAFFFVFLFLREGILEVQMRVLE